MAPRRFASAAVLPVSGIALGPPRPYAAVAAGPGGTALQSGLQSCLARGRRNTAHLYKPWLVYRY
jgi:hypothetical protein